LSWKQVLLAGDAAVLSDSNPSNVDHATAGPGTGLTASRYDHKHDLNEGIVGTLKPVDGTAATLGTDNAVPHLDHIHALGPLIANMNFNKKQATSLVLDVQTSAPGTPVDGQVYFNTTDDHPYVYVA